MDTGILENGCTNNDFLLNVKTKKNIRFKAGADVSSSVNIMDVSLDEDVTETHEFLGISIRLGSKTCPKVDPVVASN
ncbi:MAG: hypothetical protein EBR74_10740 [Flavobacteriia bacterium]|jgi:hypothetical protein|nr:hypothetical protein [Flavobacteriia bacterium]